MTGIPGLNQGGGINVQALTDGIEQLLKDHAGIEIDINGDGKIGGKEPGGCGGKCGPCNPCGPEQPGQNGCERRNPCSKPKPPCGGGDTNPCGPCAPCRPCNPCRPQCPPVQPEPPCCHHQPVPEPDPCECPGDQDKVVPAKGRIWGDPHFEHTDGEGVTDKYDVQGEAGKTYNLLSDQDLQVNGTFGQWKNSKTATVIKDLGITSGSDQIHIATDGTTTVNGQEISEGHRCEIDGGFVEKKDGKIIIQTEEYKMEVDVRKDHLNIAFESDNVNADGVMPHGLWGQVANGDGEVDKGTGYQGEGVIEGTYKDYEVGGLFDTCFTNHNQFGGGSSQTAGGYQGQGYQGNGGQPQDIPLFSFNPFALSPVISNGGMFTLSYRPPFDHANS